MSDKGRIKLIATDLDGTFLRDDKSVSVIDLGTLRLLGGKGVIRVAATGRSLHKVNEVLPPDTSFDFVVFSSGGGVYDWKSKELLVSEHFDAEISIDLCRFLVGLKLNFVVFRPIPENNLFKYHKGADRCREFENYLKRHAGDFSELKVDDYTELAGQLMAIIPNDEVLFDELRREITRAFGGIRVIRTTSPVDQRFIWLEIFPDTVSKGHGIRWLCDRLGIDYSSTVGIGNDFNDIDMLDFVGHPFILGNSPQGLRGRYCLVESTNNNSGFTEVAGRFNLLVH